MVLVVTSLMSTPALVLVQLALLMTVVECWNTAIVHQILMPDAKTWRYFCPSAKPYRCHFRDHFLCFFYSYLHRDTEPGFSTNIVYIFFVLPHLCACPHVASLSKREPDFWGILYWCWCQTCSASMKALFSDTWCPSDPLSFTHI